MTVRRRSLPGGVTEAAGLLSGRFPIAILRYPSGRFGLVGSVPTALSVEDPKSFQVPARRKSMVWEKEEDVINALLAIRITRFQRSDCSWYDAEAEATS